jgi:two-component system sensor histidine kinase DegS
MTDHSPADDPAGDHSSDEHPLAALAARARGEIDTLDHELAEIDLLIQQARSEASRHETKLIAGSEKLTALVGNRSADPREVADLNAQLVTLTKRTALMEAQVEVLAGKQKVLDRYRDALGTYATDLQALADSGVAVSAGPTSALVVAADAAGAPEPGSTGGPAPEAGAESPSPAVSRLVLGAQEDLRREIARAMHDGPAQSLTNIVLQAQIVDRLLSRDPEMAKEELRELVSMVQATLDATKSFIFDVRPMVLDDLGLVPTIRRAASERGRRTGVHVEFDSMGTDRRLSMDLESGLFRILDEALGGYLAGKPDRVSISLDWADRLEARVVAMRDRPVDESPGDPVPSPARAKGRGKGKAAAEEELPPALAAMMEDRRADAAFARLPVPLPAATWQEIEERARTIGVTAELLADGSELRLVADLPPVG